MKLTLLVFLVIIFSQLLIGLKAQNGSKCNTQCLPNYVQCKTSTTYNVCINGALYGDLQTCAANTYCSDAPSVCLPANSTTGDFVCGTVNSGNGNCGECDAGDVYTCVDKTHFTMCDNPKAYVLCDSNKICVKELRKISELICIQAIAASQLGLQPSCTSTVTTTSTTLEPPSTPTSIDATAACTANWNTNSTLKYFIIPNPSDLTTCRTYIYCEPNGDIMEATILECSSGHFYDNAQESCVSTFVNNCDSTVTA